MHSRCSSRVHTLDLRRGRGLGEPGCIILDENVTCRRGESSAKADGSKANTAIRVMLATMERIIRCFAVFARYRPEVLLCSLFLFVPVVVPPATLYTTPTHPRQQHPVQPAAAAIYAVTSTVHRSYSRPASAIKAKQRKQAPTGCPSPSCGGVIPVTSRFLSLSLALGKASSQSAWAIDKTTVGPHNTRQPAANIPPTYAHAHAQRPQQRRANYPR